MLKDKFMNKERQQHFRDIKSSIKELRAIMQDYIKNPVDKIIDEENYEKVRRSLLYILKAERQLKKLERQELENFKY